MFDVATVDGRVAGYVIARRAADEGEILNLAVAPEHRGAGIGRALAERALSALAGRGVARVFLEVRESNTVARRLYARLGFHEIARRTRYYQRPAEDAVVLETALWPFGGDA